MCYHPTVDQDKQSGALETPRTHAKMEQISVVSFQKQPRKYFEVSGLLELRILWILDDAA
jgi:hypothetical protein